MTFALLASLIWSASAGAQASNDERAILQPVIAAEARVYRACVDPTLFTAFEGERRQLKELSGSTMMGGNKEEFVRERRQELTRGERDWKRYVAGKDGLTDGTALPADEKVPLTAAVADLLRQDPRPRLSQIDRSWLAPPLVYGRRRDCPTLALSEPAVQGDLAFVETAYVCGGLCGFGQLLALRHDHDGWRIFAVADLWVS